jgi:N-acetylneuraminic acid mutarotase
MRRIVFAAVVLVLLMSAPRIFADGHSGNWTQMHPPVHPSPRFLSAMAYDAETGGVVLFGGWDGSNWGDTWAYDCNIDTWTQMGPASSPAARRSHAMAYDSESDRVILFGGYDGSYRNDTWAYDCNTDTWTQMSPPSSPTARRHHRMAYDAESDRVILFGGEGAGGYRNDTWAYDYDTDTWTQMSPPSSPTARYVPAMAYDVESDRIILFGGYDGSRLGDTWTYDYGTDAWQEVTPALSPPARYSHAMAYDAHSDLVIMFGGYDGSYRSDTWAYDCNANTWAQVSTPSSPPSREDHTMACDAESCRVILFGGSDGSDYLGDTWTFQLGSVGRDDWRQMDPDPHPCVRHRQKMAYDEESDRIILFGGEQTSYVWLHDTWAYDYGTDMWTQMNPASSPTACVDPGMAYDAESDRVILFGGAESDWYDETWAYDYNTDAWAQMHPAVHPCMRWGPVMAYDSESDRVILFGGLTGDYYDPYDLDDTWAYDYNTDTWTQMTPPSSPRARCFHAMAYDAESDRVILFGGEVWRGGFGQLDDTWAYDYNTDSWEESNPPNHPCARAALSMAYDASSDRSIIFGGGRGAQGTLDDTWAYDHKTQTWSEVACDEHPGTRVSYGLAWDGESEQVILFGGNPTGDYDTLDDTWAFGPAGFRAPDDWLWPYWNWISIPGVPDDPDPNAVFGFDCGGRLWYWDKYGKYYQVYRPPFVSFEMEVGPSYLMWLDDFGPPVSYDGYPPDTPFEFKMGRMGWTWLGRPGLQPLGSGGFMDTVMVRYPSDESGELRTAREDWASGDPWLSWGWSFWDPYAQAPRTFTPYLPWHNVCYPWCGYRCWVRVGNALSDDDPDQVTLIWP